MIVVVWLVLRYIAAVRSGRDFFIRRIPGVDAIDQAIGTAVEKGRPISFSSGLTTVSPVLYACMGVLFHIGRRVARLKASLLLPQNDSQVLSVADETIREAYRVESRSHLYEPRNMRFLSDEQFAFAAGYAGMVQREQVGAAFLFGVFAGESLILAEAGQQIGASQVAASISPEQVAFFVCTCDYTLIGEELFAASAYLTREPVQLGSLLGQDRAKLLFLVIVLIGVGIATINQFLSEPLPNIDSLILFKAWE
jgi:hypothetical protein